MKPGRRLVLLAAPEGKRARLQSQACAALGLPAPHIISWREWLTRPQCLDEALREPCWLKLEPPAEDESARRILLQRGCDLLGLDCPPHLARGELFAQHAWFAAFSQALQLLGEQVASSPARLWNSVAGIILMSDKLACQQHFQAHGLPTAQLLGQIENYRHLRDVCAQHGLRRVFLKARYGSSAAGVLAWRCTEDGREQALSSAQMDDTGRIFNSKRQQRYQKRNEIARLVDLLCAQHAYAETWLNKPRWQDAHYDIRILCIGGQAKQRVARISAQVMTNLHLDSTRGALAQMLSAQEQQLLQEQAERAAQSFAGCQGVGLDIVLKRERLHFLEANAFGDLLPNLLWQGGDSYHSQMQTMQQGMSQCTPEPLEVV